MLLDRDYYPPDYLASVQSKMKENGINVFFTLGKEIENIFLTPAIFERVIPKQKWDKFLADAESFFETERIDIVGSMLTLHKQFLPAKTDMKTVAKMLLPDFEARWGKWQDRWQLVSGKRGLSWLRDFVKRETGNDLPTKYLITELLAIRDRNLEKLVKAVCRG
jgi:hypothetical protein